MALIIREKSIKPTTTAACKDCKDRKVGCHSECPKYIEWKRAYIKRKNDIRKYNQDVFKVEDYEIKERQKNMKKRGRR